MTPDGLFRYLSSVSCGAFVLATDQTVVFWNRRAREILGYTPGRVVGRRCSGIASKVDGLALTGDCEDGCMMLRSLRAGLVPGRARLRMRCSWGEWKWLTVTPMVVSGVVDDGPLLVYMFEESGERAVAADIGQLVELAEVIIGLDPLRDQFGTGDLEFEHVPAEVDRGASDITAEGPGLGLASGNDYLMLDGPRPGPNEGSDEEDEAGSEPRDPGRLPGGVHLTEREREVLSYLALGWETKYIAEELGVSWYTARNHVRNIRRKLDASTRLEAVMTAMRLGIIARE